MPADLTIDEFLKSLGVIDHPGLRVNPRIEGYRDYTFGCRAGPSGADVSNLAHELAHAAQFGPKAFRGRAKSGSFHFKEPWRKVAGQMCLDARTAQATLRELDTFAHQAHLMELVQPGFDRSTLFTYAADLLTDFMHDWYAVPGESEQERKAWCYAKAQEFYGEQKPEDVLLKLMQWLDATAVQLSQSSKGGADVAP